MTLVEAIVDELSGLEESVRVAVAAKRITRRTGQMLMESFVHNMVMLHTQQALRLSQQPPAKPPASGLVVPSANLVKPV